MSLWGLETGFAINGEIALTVLKYYKNTIGDVSSKYR